MWLLNGVIKDDKGRDGEDLAILLIIIIIIIIIVCIGAHRESV